MNDKDMETVTLCWLLVLGGLVFFRARDRWLYAYMGLTTLLILAGLIYYELA